MADAEGKMYIVIKADFIAQHNWPDAPEPVDFLREMHRHKFFVTVKFEVGHDDRELEFFIMQSRVDRFLLHSYGYKQLIGKSCEMMCKEIGDFFNADFVSVYEDDENGAEYHRKRI